LSVEAEPLVSVIIPAYRAAGSIGNCVASLCEQREPPAFEVVVVDSSPDDSTLRTVRAFQRAQGGSLDLQIVSSAERLYPGTARNLGVRHARSSRLLFLDADCVAHPELLSRVVVALDGGASAVGGCIELPVGASVSARIRHLMEFKESLPGVPGRTTWQLPSACLAMTRSAFERHGGFPDTRASEDWLLNWSMWQAGEPMSFDPRLRIRHDTPAGWSGLVRYARTLGRASGEARRAGGLPGQVLVRYPWLALALPFGRTLRAFVWCARYAPAQAFFLLFTWPVYFVIAAIWARAFHIGVRAGKSRPGAEPSSI
jgi:glycosyltransferase involved in cell wall biosynthesis